MKKLLLTLFFLLFAFPASAKALELLMAHNPDCHICERFINEVAVDYNDSELVKRIQLRFATIITNLPNRAKRERITKIAIPRVDVNMLLPLTSHVVFEASDTRIGCARCHSTLRSPTRR